jgi:cytoskeletal protein RodZ
MAKTAAIRQPIEPAAEANPLDLRNFRQKRGISLEQIADSTKISIRFLRAIESEDYDQLPGGIFNRSYLRQYAAATGFDEKRLLAHYERETASSDDVKPPKTAKRKPFLVRCWKALAAPGQ